MTMQHLPLVFKQTYNPNCILYPFAFVVNPILQQSQHKSRGRMKMKREPMNKATALFSTDHADFLCWKEGITLLF